MEFVSICANLRATNYSIPCCELNEARKIVGNVIPAIVTTTAVVGGMMIIEILKQLQNLETNLRREYSWNLNNPAYWYSNFLFPPDSRKFGNRNFTAWDYLSFNDCYFSELLLKIEVRLLR